MGRWADGEPLGISALSPRERPVGVQDGIVSIISIIVLSIYNL
jgi:hypothetical protein